MNFSSSLRERVVAEALSRSQTQGEIAEQFGVGRSTVQNWLRQSRKNGSKMDSKTKKPQSWSREQRLEALLETHQLSEEALGKWCREHGLHTHHLVQWRKELTKDTSSMDHEARSLRQENRDLKTQRKGAGREYWFSKKKRRRSARGLYGRGSKAGVGIGGRSRAQADVARRRQALGLSAANRTAVWERGGATD